MKNTVKYYPYKGILSTPPLLLGNGSSLLLHTTDNYTQPTTRIITIILIKSIKFYDSIFIISGCERISLRFLGASEFLVPRCRRETRLVRHQLQLQENREATTLYVFYICAFLVSGWK